MISRSISPSEFNTWNRNLPLERPLSPDLERARQAVSHPPSCRSGLEGPAQPIETPDHQCIPRPSDGQRFGQFHPVSASARRSLNVDLLASASLQRIDLERIILPISTDARVAEKRRSFRQPVEASQY
jgi:hypothetical protein